METTHRISTDTGDVSEAESENEARDEEEVVDEDATEKCLFRVVARIGAREKMDILMYEGNCWPLTKFWEILGHDDLFWDFDSLSKMEHKMNQRSCDLGSFLGHFCDLGICNGYGMSAHGFTHV
jgi:hypothetical protein